MRLQFGQDVVWDGRTLSAWVHADGQQIKCVVARDAIHCLPLYNDAIGREIERDALDIMDRLKPYILSKLAAQNATVPGHRTAINLLAQDVG